MTARVGRRVTTSACTSVGRRDDDPNLTFADMYRTKPVPAGPARPTTVLDLAAGSSPDLPCRQHDPDLWFSTAPAGLERAKLLCAECPIRRECLAAAVERAEPWGVWGGEIVEHGTVIPRKRPPGRPRKDDPYRVPRVPCRPGSRRLPAGVESDRALLPVRTSEPSCSLDALRTAVRRRNADGRGSEHAPRVGLRAVDVGEAVLGCELRGGHRPLVPPGPGRVGGQCGDGAADEARRL